MYIFYTTCVEGKTPFVVYSRFFSNITYMLEGVYVYFFSEHNIVFRSTCVYVPNVRVSNTAQIHIPIAII